MAYTGSSKVNWYQTRGFYLLGSVQVGGLRAYSAAAVKIYKGDALHMTTAPNVTNATTQFASTFVGIAASQLDNGTAYAVPRLPGFGTGAADPTQPDNFVLVIPPLAQYQFIVPVYNALVTTSALGTIVDMPTGVNGYTIDVSDTTGGTQAVGFQVDDIDISTAAVAANTYGYAIGHFVMHNV